MAAENKLVMKSRPVQTSLTRDPALELEDSNSPGIVTFQVRKGPKTNRFFVKRASK